MTELTPELKEKMTRELPSLALRVREGNDKLIAAWLKIIELADTQPEVYKAGMAKFDLSIEKLNLLCRQLMFYSKMLQGKSDCLYIMNGQKVKKCDTNPMCWVCPSEHPYWQEEWSEFARAMAEVK